MEAAGGLARLGPDISVSSRIPRLGEIKGIAPPVKAGDLVRLWRPSIGAVEVPVRAVNARFQTGRYSRDEVEATFSGVIVIDDQVESGDTGAPVLDKDNKLVGLVLGRGFGGTAVAPIEPLLRAYNVSLTLTDVTPPGGQGGTPP